MSTTSPQASQTLLLTAREAAQRLGIGVPSLYVYVSEGRLRSIAVPGVLGRRYRSEEIDALISARKPWPKAPSTVTFSARLTAEQALAFRSAAKASGEEPSGLVRRLMLGWLEFNGEKGNEEWQDP